MRARHISTLVLAVLAGAAQAQSKVNEVTSVSVKDEGTRVAIVIQGTRPPNFTTFSMADPPRFVIDLSESRFQGVPPDINVEDGFINVIKNLSYGSDVTSIARVMVAFAVEVDPPETPETVGNTLVVRFAKPAGAAAIAKATEADRRAKEEAEAKARAEAEAQARAEAEARARAEAEAKAQADARAEADAKARQEQEAADASAKAEQARHEKELADARAAEEAASQAAAEARAREVKERAAIADQGGKAEEDVLQGRTPAVSKAEQARIASEQAAAETKAAAERKAQELADAQARADEERRAREQAATDRRAAEAQAAVDRKTAAEQAAADRKAAAEQAAADKRAAAEQAAAERRSAAEQAAAEKKAKVEEARRAREQAIADRKAAAERKRQEAADAKARAKEERLAKLEQAKADREAARTAKAERLSSGAPVARLKEIGFKQLPGTSRVFVRTDVTPRFTVQDVGEDVVRVEFENTRVARRNDTRFMDTSFFPSAVAMITPSRKGDSYVVEIKLKQKVPYQQKVEADTFAIDFERPAGVAAPAEPAAAPPGTVPGTEPGTEPGAEPAEGEPPADEPLK